jgi:hypothetical protein
MTMERTPKDIAADLNSKPYPNVSACALLGLRRVEQLRSKPGYERARHWGHGPADEELQKLGLAIIGEPEFTLGARPVDMTDLGRAVAEALEELRS